MLYVKLGRSKVWSNQNEKKTDNTVDRTNPAITSWGWQLIPLFTQFYTSQGGCLGVLSSTVSLHLSLCFWNLLVWMLWKKARKILTPNWWCVKRWWIPWYDPEKSPKKHLWEMVILPLMGNPCDGYIKPYGIRLMSLSSIFAYNKISFVVR